MLLLFVSIACANMLIPSYAAIRFEFMIPESLIAIPDAFFILTSACCALIWGYFTDRIDRTKVIIAAAFSWTIGMILTAFSINYFMLVISRMFSGMGLGSVLPVGYSIISDAIPPDERSGWFGTLAILSSISNGIGQALSSFLGPILTWRFPFFLLSVISIIIVFSLFFVKIPRRGVSEEELIELTKMNLEYSYRISSKDLGEIGKIKTNLYLIIQGFFMIIPGTILVYFTTSMLSLHFFNELPNEIRLQTATIFAGLMGIGYILGNMIISYISDILFRKNKKNRTRLATFCMIIAIPFSITMLLLLRPIEVDSLNIIYPTPIPTSEIAKYMFLTIGEIFSVYPTYLLFFFFALISSILGAGPVANKNAVMIDVNLPEHRGTIASFFNLSEQIGKGVTLLTSYLLISFFSYFSFPSDSSIYNMMFFSMFFWIPASIFWYRASKTVESDMIRKSVLLSERKQISLLDYIFELEMQMDRGIQKIQDSKYYILTDSNKFNKLLDDAIKIFSYCEREGGMRSITNIKTMCNELNLKARSIKNTVNQIYGFLNNEDLSEKEKELYIADLEQIFLKIAEGEKSTFGELQIYYEDAYLKIVEARLLRKNDLVKSLAKVSEAINIYQRVKNLLSERLEVINENSEISKEDSMVLQKEKDLFEKTSKSLIATTRLKSEFEEIFNQLKEKGISKEDLIKISELTLEFNIDFYQVMTDTFGQDKETKNALKKIVSRIEKIFYRYDYYKEVELKVF
jgi:MFS family permease